MIRLINGVEPEIILDRQCYHNVQDLVRLTDIEISWLSDVTIINPLKYKIHNIYLPEQTCCSVRTEMEEDSLIEIGQERLKTGGIEAFNLIRFWGHSHVNMGVSPSGQDESQLRQLATRAPYFIGGVFNKKGEMFFWLYDSAKGLIYDNLKWSIEGDVEKLAELDKKVIRDKTIFFDPGSQFSPPTYYDADGSVCKNPDLDNLAGYKPKKRGKKDPELTEALKKLEESIEDDQNYEVEKERLLRPTP